MSWWPARKPSPPIPRISLLWLLVAQVLVVVPHLGHLPAWIVGLWLVCAAWRIQVFRQRTSYPGALTKGLMLLAAAVGVYASRGSLIGLDAGTALLIATFLLKLVELKTRRDALVLVFLGFFVVLTGYLFDDSLPAALYSLLPVTVLLAALIGLQHAGLGERPWPTLRLAAGLLLQATPLMLAMFLLFPRLGPLWSVPVPGERARTGLAESMTPGDIAELGRSPELAFRVSFDGSPPPRSALYWRALTFEQFDGRRWSQLAEPPLAEPAWRAEGPRLSYSIVMQPSGQPWLFALDTARSELEQTRLMGDFRLQRRRPVEQNLLYSVTSWPEARREPDGSPRLRPALQLPAEGNPRARQWAEQLRQQHAEPQALVDALLAHFARERFFYTLRPPLAGADTVDHFLFDSRRGFCAHYAGAMTFVLRAAGIPARVVAGYQGGEYNPAGDYLLVHQFDAHAWVEYWLPGRGWISVDPTFQVAPERIEQGLEQALPAEDEFRAGTVLSPLRYRDVAWLNRLRLSWDGLNYAWQRKVLGYQGEAQLALFREWLGQVDGRRLGLLLVGSAALLLGLLALLLLKPWKREQDPLLRQYRRFEGLLARHGLRRAPGEGPLAFAERAALALPGQAEEIRAFARRFVRQRYAAGAMDPGELRGCLRRLRRSLPYRWREVPPAAVRETPGAACYARHPEAMPLAREENP
ncbi:transglutaminaseTgpA domain-containing protein [Pseudomonas stutzeri]|nr:transglutaminaseTgpA domain-containing protein [Stutzerimonas stutzeri]